MKLWRKKAKKEFDLDPKSPSFGMMVRTGRKIKREMWVAEMSMQRSPKMYPLLERLLKRAEVDCSAFDRHQELIQSLYKTMETPDETI